MVYAVSLTNMGESRFQNMISTEQRLKIKTDEVLNK